MSEYTPANSQNLDIEVDVFLSLCELKDYAPGRGGRKFQLPKRKSILKRSRDLRISPRDAAIDTASQQVRHVKFCRDKNCGYTWCGTVKGLLEHWKCCSERKNMKKCIKCDSLKVLFLRAQGTFVAPPNSNNRNTNNRNNRNGGNNIMRNNRYAHAHRGAVATATANNNINNNINVSTNLNSEINLNTEADTDTEVDTTDILH